MPLTHPQTNNILKKHINTWCVFSGKYIHSYTYNKWKEFIFSSLPFCSLAATKCEFSLKVYIFYITNCKIWKIQSTYSFMYRHFCIVFESMHFFFLFFSVVFYIVEVALTHSQLVLSLVFLLWAKWTFIYKKSRTCIR